MVLNTATANSIEAMPRPTVGSLAGKTDEEGIARIRGDESVPHGCRGRST